MELTTVLRKIAESAEKIISARPGLTNYDKGNYEFLKQEWPKLKNEMKNWEEIDFSNADFEKTEFYERFSTICHANMRKIVKDCKCELDKIEKKEISNSKKQTKRNNLYDKFKTGGVIASIITLCGIILAHIDSKASMDVELRYEQGKQDARNELTNTLNDQQNAIQNLLDSLEKLKLRNAELEKCIKLKKTCK